MQNGLIVLIGYVISTVFGQYYFVTLPNVIRFNNDETVSVNVFGLTNAQVEVWLESHRSRGRFSNFTVNVQDENTPVIRHIKITEKDLQLHEQDNIKPDTVTVCSKLSSSTADCQDIPLSYETGYIIVQTDKPIYTPNQRVSIRALVVDESFKVGNNEKIWMDIVSPSDKTVGRIKKGNSNNGFYRHSFDLPPHPEIGLWTARVFLKGQYETTGHAVFQVKEYVLPTYGVTIDINVSLILPDTNEFEIAVKARYVYGKHVNGNARLDMYLSGKGTDDEHLLSTKRKALLFTGDDHSIAVFNVQTSNIMATQVVSNIFPEGKILKIIATVYEQETGIEENDLHDKTLFTRSPFRFMFTRSKMYFRPGMEYLLKVDLSYPNGVPVPNKVVNMILVGNSNKTKSTDSNGRASSSFETTHNTVLNFKVSANGYGRDWESDSFVVSGFNDKNQIDVEVATVDGQSQLRAYSNSQGTSYTGMLFMVVARGKILKTEYKSTGNKVSVPFSDILKREVSPSGRLLVFYVDKSYERIVVDSVKFDVEHVCRGKELTVTPQRPQISPGQKTKITLSGDKNMFVGLNIMDKALLLLNNKNILKRNTLFETLDSHDIGCGQGSGYNSEDVFKRAGLTILTNANIKKDLLKEKSLECDWKHRARRHVKNFCSEETQVCCEEGERYAYKVIESDKKASELNKKDSDEVHNNDDKASEQSKKDSDEVHNNDDKASELNKKDSDEVHNNDDKASELNMKDSDEVPNSDDKASELNMKDSDEVPNNDDKASEQNKIDPFITCYSKARSLLKKDEVHSSVKCVTAIFLSCFNVLDQHAKGIQTGSSFRASDLFDSNPYIEDLTKALERGGGIRVRSDFRESWKFTELDLDGDGKKEEDLVYPDSITEWMIQAVGISAEGVCIAEPANVITFRDVFIQLHLPYKAIRLEQIEVKTTVFNYAANNMTAYVYLKGTKELCYDSEGGIAKPTKRTTVVVPSHSAQTVRFPVIPLKTGKFVVRASLFANFEFTQYTDEVEKTLLVDHEGIEERITIQACLDPHNKAKDCKQDKRVTSETYSKGIYATQILKINLTLPESAIPNTGSGTAYLQGVVIENTIQTLLQNGVKGLLQRPSGCGEQTMYGLALSVYAMNYMKQTMTMDIESEKKGYNYIRHGIDREITFRKSDGSYSAWWKRPSSTWVTAYIIKVFCQAKKVVDDAVYSGNIEKSIQWLESTMSSDGTYIEEITFYHINSHSLVAFVLITLHECSRFVQSAVSKPMKYIENLDRNMLRNNPYTLAISTYALALSKSTKRYEFLGILKTIKTSSDDDGTHWNNDVETTSYALLAILQLEETLEMSGDVVKWLTSKRKANGGFESTQVTVVGLQALAEYSVKAADPELNLKVSALADKWGKNNKYSLTHDNGVLQKIIRNLPVEIGKKELTIEVKGEGSGRMMIDLRYNRHGTKNERCAFTVSNINVSEVDQLNNNIKANGLMECDVCGKNCDKISDSHENEEVLLEDEPKRFLSNEEIKKPLRQNVSPIFRCVEFSVRTVSNSTGMAVVIFGLETGVEIVSSDIDKFIDETENIDAYENDGKGFAVFYLSEITTNETRFKFRLKDTFDEKEGKRESRQPAVVSIYDYYNPDVTCTKMYRSVGETFSLKCDKSSSSMTCQCESNLCPSFIDEKLVKQAKENKRPALQLKRYTCNIDKANYAVIVTIGELENDADNNEVKVYASVTKSIYQGRLELMGEEITLLHPRDCEFPKFISGNEYYIIGQESINEYEYILSSSTLIIEKPQPRTRLNSIMKKYENFMERGCDD